MVLDPGPKWALQVACVALWRASDDIKTMLGDTPRIYEDVQEKPVFPYVTLGAAQTLPDRMECIDGFEVYPNFDIWSRASSFKESSTIAAVMLAAIRSEDLAPAGYSVVSIDLATQHDMVDPDGVTRHTVLTLKALVEPL